MDFLSIVWQSLSITLFVISMMLVIEYLNVLTKGIWSEHLQKNPWKQVLLGAGLGIIPGCLGAYTAVSLYVHNIFSTGALVAAMIATSGDEAFFMFSIIPAEAILITVLLFIIAVLAGFAVNAFQKKKGGDHAIKHFHIHGDEADSFTFNRRRIAEQLKDISRTRLLLLIILFVSMVLVIFNFENLLHGLSGHEHSGESSPHIHPTWVGITFTIVLGLSFFVVATVSDHFLQDHLIGHIVKRHVLRIFLWTFATLFILNLLHQYIHLEEIITENLTLVLLIAVLVGIVPESGPHLVFVILYASGDIPLSILLASSIVQDGHGSLPLLAESPKSFFKVKAINVAIGLIIGGVALYAGI
jgi:hypothetical protein